MSNNPNAAHIPGKAYGTNNKIPTINQFIERLDKDKADRDRQADEIEKFNQNNSDARDHKSDKPVPKRDQKLVNDPVTGRQVVIEDVSSDTMQHVKDDMVRQQRSP